MTFRLRPGDDASCLNLYQPRNPRILAPPAAFLRSAHFTFQDAIEKTANPWLLLECQRRTARSRRSPTPTRLTYALHLKLGEEFTLNGTRYPHRGRAAGQPVSRRAADLGEQLPAPVSRCRGFPLLPAARRTASACRPLEAALSDYGFDIQPSAARLAELPQVENTYLSTFRSLGALGWCSAPSDWRRSCCATCWSGGANWHCCARWISARRPDGDGAGRKPAAPAAGPRHGHDLRAVAIAPALSQRGGHLPLVAGALLAAILVTAPCSLAATAAALRSPLLAALDRSNF